MQDYQEEYVANLRRFADLSQRERPGTLTEEEYAAQLEENQAQIVRLSQRNMQLLRTGLFPMLDDLFGADQESVRELEEFSFQLFNGQKEYDVGLFCQIHQALLTLARQKQDMPMIIRELYWLGMGRYGQSSKLVGLELTDIQKYVSQMRLCFSEAAAYLRYFDLINDTETRGYILRSRANVALGPFASPSEKLALLKDSLSIFQNRRYQDKAPSLPWGRFIYLTHQNITASISHNRSRTMSRDDISNIMESAYIVYARRLDKEEIQGKQPPAKSAFAYYALEFQCGLYGVDALLSRTEALLNAADPTDYSADGMYGMISLPAFYSQYLSQYPEFIPSRTNYVEGLYRRMLDYMDAYPGGVGNAALFLYLRQLSFAFVETDGGVSYGEFLQKLLLRFATDIFLHCHIVGAAARAFCGIILDRDPGFFDEISFIGRIESPAEKRQAVLDFALGCGIFHDVGKICVMELYTRTPRQWFHEEYEMAQLHTTAGAAYLSPRASTSRYADAALGHHMWYDGSHGYPSSYRRSEAAARRMVDVISLISWLENNSGASLLEPGSISFENAVQSAIELGGRRFSPLLTAFLRDGETVKRLKHAYAQGRRDACRLMYLDARRAAPQAS